MQNDVKNLKMVHVIFFGSKNLVIVEEMLKKAGIEIVCGYDPCFVITSSTSSSTWRKIRKPPK